MNNEVTKIQLANGMTVHLKEIHSAPLISHWVWYKVGARDEQVGLTGLSHWVEHMQFKGTHKFPAGDLDKAISREGGEWNAMTSLDWTAFYEKLPADRIDLALELEADRMVNSRFDPDEVESERTVIISEREGHENEPLFRLDEAVQHLGFDQHPYRIEVIGEKEDLRRISREDLYRHYRSFYVPNNAVLAIAGDFDTAEMLLKIQEQYGGIASADLPQRVAAEEPPLNGERRVVVSGPEQTSYLRLSYRAPRASDPDFFPFLIADSLLAGPAGLNRFGGGGITNKTSRLYQSLVERELAVAVGAGLQATIDPYLYDVTAIVHPAQTPDAVLSAYDDEIKRLQDQQVSAEEITRAVKQARAMFVYGSENISNQAFWMGYAEMFADYGWFETYLDELEKITPEDVQRIARTYLLPERRVVGFYLPEEREA
jgi:zinc protease